MTGNKMYNRQRARNVLTAKGITWYTFNNDTHWKIGSVDFWPTTHKWIDNKNGELKEGLPELVNHIIGCQSKDIELTKKYTVQQFYKIALKSEDRTMAGICEAIHKEIYK